MTDKNVWFVTGAGRGMGVDIAKAALGAGHAVVATGRNANAAAKALLQFELIDVVNQMMNEGLLADYATDEQGNRLFGRPGLKKPKRASSRQRRDQRRWTKPASGRRNA